MRSLAGEVEALIGRPLGDEPIAVAVSGGGDSLALLLLAQDAFGPRVRALTVDHALRAESASEASLVSAICARLGIMHQVLVWEGTKPATGRQAAARAARYALMDDWCRRKGVAWILTAHHADDQAETLLMRLARGAGLAGLAGVRPSRALSDGVTVLRPLLSYRRHELAAIVERARLAPVDDPSNRDPRYDRTHARAWLAGQGWLPADRVAASAAHLADCEAALEWAADLAWRSRTLLIDGRVDVDVLGLPRELQRRLLCRVLSRFGTSDIRGASVERLLGRLQAGGTATLGTVRARGGPVWRFDRAPARRSGAAGS